MRKLTLAYHEVGHAVIASRLRLKVQSVSIVPDKTRGTAEWYSAGRVTLADTDYGRRGIITILSGIEAQVMFAPSSRRPEHAAGDMEKAKSLVGLGSTKHPDPEIAAMLEARWQSLLEETKTLVRKNRHVIEYVAKKLLMVGEMTGRELRGHIRDAQLTLGSPPPS